MYSGCLSVCHSESVCVSTYRMWLDQKVTKQVQIQVQMLDATVRGRDGDEMISHMFCAFRCIFHTEFYFRLGCCDLGDFVVGYIMSIK